MTPEQMRVALKTHSKLRSVTVLSYTLKKYQDLLGEMMENGQSFDLDGIHSDLIEITEKLIDEIMQLHDFIEATKLK
jgi:hypothetical protein